MCTIQNNSREKKVYKFQTPIKDESRPNRPGRSSLAKAGRLTVLSWTPPELIYSPPTIQMYTKKKSLQIL
jgi:hypothetical protein